MAESGFDTAEFHCHRCGTVVTATSTDPEAFGRQVAEHRARCPQGVPATVEECPRNPGGGHMHKPAALKAGHWCAYCGAPKPAAAVQGA